MNIQNLSAYALSVSSDTKYAAFSSDAWAKAFEVTLLGLGMVFAVLAILWLALSVFKFVFAKNTKKNKKTDTAAPAPAAEPEPTVAQTDDGELVAVITAAIAAYRSSEEGLTGEAAGGFRVVSFKRAAGGRAWNSNK